MSADLGSTLIEALKQIEAMPDGLPVSEPRNAVISARSVLDRARLRGLWVDDLLCTLKHIAKFRSEAAYQHAQCAREALAKIEGLIP